MARSAEGTGGYRLQQVFRSDVKGKCLEMILGFEPELMLELSVNVRKKSHRIHKKGGGDGEEVKKPLTQIVNSRKEIVANCCI